MGVVDVLVELGCLARLLGPFASVDRTDCLFLPLEECDERGVEDADACS